MKPTKREQAKEHLAKPIKVSALSSAQQRMLIATDAIAQLDAKVTRAEHGTYFEAAAPLEGSSTYQSLDDAKAPLTEAIANAEVYTVCALGACFAATVSRFKPKLTFHTHGRLSISAGWASGFEHENVVRAHVYVGAEIVRKTLRKYFSREQIGLMETAFERHPDARFFRSAVGRRKLTDEDREQLARAYKFGHTFRSDAARLRAIMQNVIDNCGEFKP